MGGTGSFGQAVARRLAAAGIEERTAANVTMNEVAAAGLDPAAVRADELAKVVAARETLPRPVYAEAVAASASDDFRAERYIKQAAVADTAELEPLIQRVLAGNEGQVAAYRAGKAGLLGFFVGQVMRESKGQANPKVVNELLREKLRP